MRQQVSTLNNKKIDVNYTAKLLKQENDKTHIDTSTLENQSN